MRTFLITYDNDENRVEPLIDYDAETPEEALQMLQDEITKGDYFFPGYGDSAVVNVIEVVRTASGSIYGPDFEICTLSEDELALYSDDNDEDDEDEEE